jgi:hypothetical protein
MKVVFAGSSLYGSSVDVSGLDVRAPARQGDILAAVNEGARAVGLIDGEFGQHAAVWHKEILFALDRGVAVFGASSMGALRAAECASFGMVPVGVIANAYLDGRLDDDAAVALLMAPAELGSFPMSEPLVDAEATLDRMLALHLIGARQHAALLRRARALHFSKRTEAAMFEGEPEMLLSAYQREHVSQKRSDAELLVAILRLFDPLLPRERPAFRLAQSPYWTGIFAGRAR